jgi:hypothetical protein
MSVELVSAASEPRTTRRWLRRFSPWALLVVGSLIAVIAGAAVLAAWWLASSRTTTAAYAVPGTLLGIELRVQSGNVTIVRGSQTAVLVSRTDHSVYGHGPREQRLVRLGILHLVSSCPGLVLGSCVSDYLIEVPDNVSINVRAEHGAVHVEGYQGSANITTNAGSITVEGYCGLVLAAASTSGSISVGTSCSAERLALFSGSGSIAVTVPPGSYRIDAASQSGNSRISRLVNDAAAPWNIQAISNSGNVTVAADT